MPKLILSSTSYGYKILVNKYSYSPSARKIDKKTGLNIKNVVGHIFYGKSLNGPSNYYIVLDMNQLYQWYIVGAKFSKSINKFNRFFKQFLMSY